MEAKDKMRDEIINILKQIEEAEDTKEKIFPLLFKLSELKNHSPSEFTKIFKNEEDEEIVRFIGGGESDLGKGILLDRMIKYIPLNEDWRKYKDGRKR